jgi:hypothetical protein
MTERPGLIPAQAPPRFLLHCRPGDNRLIYMQNPPAATRTEFFHRNLIRKNRHMDKSSYLSSIYGGVSMHVTTAAHRSRKGMHK